MNNFWNRLFMIYKLDREERRKKLSSKIMSENEIYVDTAQKFRFQIRLVQQVYI